MGLSTGLGRDLALAALGGRAGGHFPALALQPLPGWAPPPPSAPPPELGRGGRAPRTDEEEAARLEFLTNQPQLAAAAASAQATASAAPVPLPRTLATGAPASAHPQARASASLARALTTATPAPLEAPEAGTHEAKFRHLLDMHHQGAARLRQLRSLAAFSGRPQRGPVQVAPWRYRKKTTDSCRSTSSALIT